MSSEDLSDVLLFTVKSGNLEQLKTIYQSNISLEQIARQAAQHDQPQILEWCYTQGWKPPPRSFNGPFFISAISGGSPAIFQVLTEHGWNFKNHESETCGDALAGAVIGGHYDLAKWLLEHGHEPTPVDPIHPPSCMVSTVWGDTASLKMLKLMLSHGVQLNECGVGVAAADEGNLEALRLLLDHGVDKEDRDMSFYPFDEERDEAEESQGTALYRACRQGHLGCVVLLLDRGANARAQDDGGTSCHAIARKRGHPEVVKVLEDMGITE